jgi:hypothetical protein
LDGIVSVKQSSRLALLICGMTAASMAANLRPWTTVFEDRFDTTASLRNWEVLEGEWQLTSEGIRRHGTGGAALLQLRQPVAYGAVRVEYEAMSDEPGDLSLALGTSDSALTNIVFSPQGRDTWSGALPDPTADSSDGPLATIQAARDRLRAVKKERGLAGGATVWLRGGRYALDSPLVFTPEDSGSFVFCGRFCARTSAARGTPGRPSAVAT